MTCSGRLAVIPARGGSKRIPRKNLAPFAGKPMISYAIDVALRSALFDHVVVSTDDPEIARAAVDCGAAVPFMRPAALADDFAPTVAVVAHAVAECRRLGWRFESTCCIYPSVPLLLPRDLADGLALLEEGGAPYVFPVVAFRSPVQRALLRSEDGSVRPMFPGHALTRTQDLPLSFHDAGQFYWGRAQAWLDGLSLHEHARCTVLPAHRAVDIDTPEDLALAEALYAIRGAGRGEER